MPRLGLLSLLLFATTALGAENDLSVAWISRLPRIDYVWNSPNPTVEGWPATGSTVTWVANVRWLGAEPLHNVKFRWTIDGAEVRRGTLDFAAGSLVQAELPWTWTFTRHEIAFEIDGTRKIPETEERNNRVAVDSDAIAIGLYVERTFWETLGARAASAGIGARTFDDWMQHQVLRFNDMARYALYPEDGDTRRWAYLESLQFNLAYWSGHTELADYDVTADPALCHDRLGPAVEPLPEALVTTREVRLRFTVDVDVAYKLYWTVNGGPPTEVFVPARANGGRAEGTLPLPAGRIVWWFVDAYSYVHPHCPLQHELVCVRSRAGAGARSEALSERLLIRL